MPSVEWIGAHGSNYTAGRGGRKVDTIGIHYTATNASARNNGIYFSRAGANASAHYFVDGSGTVIQSVSEADTAWALGDWDANQRAISIEVVSAGQDFTAAEISELRWLVRDIMGRYGIPASRVIRHYDVTGKRCPAPYVDAAKWAKLRDEIAREEETEEKEEDMNLGDRITDGYIMDGTTYATVGNCLYWAESNGEKTLALVRQLTAQVTALGAAVEALSAAQGADPEEIAAKVGAAVEAKLEGISLAVDVK